MTETLFQKYGGFPTLTGVVITFYDKVLASNQIGKFFEDVDMKRLMDHQAKFIASMLGGPVSYSNDRLRHIHGHLGISDMDFDEMSKLLGEALKEHGFEPVDCDAVIHEIEARRSYVVSRGAG